MREYLFAGPVTKLGAAAAVGEGGRPEFGLIQAILTFWCDQECEPRTGARALGWAGLG